MTNTDRSQFYEERSFKNVYDNFLQLLINAGWMIMPARVNNGWLEVDTIDDLKLYEKLSSEGKLDTFGKLMNK